MENSIDAWSSYKSVRNLHKVKLVNSKNQYINNKINTAIDQKETWNRIKNLVLGKPRNVIKTVIFEGITYTENV